jgi:UDP-N-acetylmuramoyl-tripeptide--D-alanyl-D-alanine ligase
MSPACFSLEAAAAATQGTVLRRGAGGFEGVCCDSRQLRSGQAFVALVGARFDGHEFCAAAAAGGAGALVVSRPLPASLPASVAVLQVADTRLALGALARAWRRELAPRVAAITGSVGKTTTKELAAAVLAEAGLTHSTPGNLNNDIGLPLTLLGMGRGTRFLVAEMGMNAPGEIAYLTRIAEPDVGLVTCVAPVHLEGLGSLEAVAAAKGELLAGLAPDAWGIVPGDAPLLAPYAAAVAPERRLRFGSGAADDVRLERVTPRGIGGSDVELSLRGERLSFRLPLVGAHNARNAAAAAAVGFALGVPGRLIAAALSREPQLSHRSVLRSVGPWRVLDDCYNANPVAVCAALDTVVELARTEGLPREVEGVGEQRANGRSIAPGNGSGAARSKRAVLPRPTTLSIAVLGSMLELGAEAARLHRDVGAHAATVGLGLLITVGELAGEIAAGALEAGMPGERIVQASEIAEASRVVVTRATPGAWILVKASRGAHLEGLIDRLQAEAGA